MSRRQICFNSLVLVVGLALTSGVWAADPDLVGLWKLDETSGMIASDSSGGGNDGTLVGSPQWVFGRIKGGLKLSGTGDHVALPIGSLMGKLDKATIGMWLNWSGLSNTWARIIDWGTGQTTYIYVTPSDGTGKFHAAITVNSSWTDLAAPNGFPSGGWHHMAVTLGDKTSKTLRLLVDGEEVASGTSQWILSDLGNTTQNWLGRSEYSADPYLNATLDDLRIYDRILSDAEIKVAMLGGEIPGPCSQPQPEQSATDVVRDVSLSWTPGPYAKTHDVYLGTDFDDVNSASRADTRGVSVASGQDASTYNPAGPLAFSQTYYWRVDEVNAPPDSTTFKGNIWTFTVEAYSYAVKPVKATASGSSNAAMGPEKTIDSSGIDASTDQHSTSGTQMWLSKKGQSPIWIKYDFDKAYKLDKMWVWNSNQAIELDNGFGAKGVTIETSLDGTTWTTLAGVSEFAQATAEPNYVHNTTVDFAGTLAKYVRVTITSNWGAATKQAGLSEVRFFYLPVKAYQPAPVTGGTGVAVDAVLNWRPGRQAARHDVYFGTDPNALVLAKTVTDHRCSLSSLGAEYGKTCYWRVDEVNDAATPTSWTGDVWSFSTPDSFVVEDFEKYNDKCNRIFWIWIDGLGSSGSGDCGVAAASGNGSGSTVGNAVAPFAEQTIVHSGSQSMPLFYDNTTGPGYSEAVLTLAAAQDWTKGGAKTLVLYFYGAADNGAGQLYVKINNVKVQYTGTAAAIVKPMWKQWNIDLTSVAGVQSVKTLTVGVSGSGKGVLYIDDILLYRAAPAVVVPVNPGTANLQAYYPLDGTTNDTSGHGYNGTAIGNQFYVDAPAGRGKAIQLNGTNDYVDLPTLGTLVSTMSSTTVAAWANFSYPSTGTVGWERIFDFGTGSTNYMFLSARQLATSAEVFGILTTGGTEVRCTAPRPMGTGWHHLAVVIDSATMRATLYLDGTAVATNTTTMLPKDLGNTTQNWFGRSQFTADGYYAGMLDEVRIYNRALTVGEVRYLAGEQP